MEENEGAGPFAVTHRLVLSIAIPMTLGFLTTPLLGLTDTAVAGRLGSADALAGLAVGAVIFDLECMLVDSHDNRLPSMLHGILK